MAVFDVKRFKSLLKTELIGRNITYKEVIGTSMDDAREGAFNGAPHGSVYLSEIQTKARGARDHKWNAKNKGNLYFSVILHRPHPQSEENIVERVDLECIAGLSLLKVLEEIGLKKLSLKWQNDLWCRGHKIAGSLAENGDFLKGTHTGKYFFILGVGMNVNSDIRRNDDLLAIASSVKCEKNGQHADREQLFANFCYQLQQHLEYNHDEIYEETMKYQLFQTGDLVNVIEMYGNTYPAMLQEIRNDWKVVLRDECNKEIIGMKEFSLRPVKTQYIYIYNGYLALPWSAQCLSKTFSAIVDTSVYTVETLDESKFTAGHWTCDAVMIVIGDLDLTKSHVMDYFSSVKEFVASGKHAFVVRNGSSALYPHIRFEKEMEKVFPVSLHATTLKGTEIMHAICLGEPLILNKEEDSKICGYYGNEVHSQNDFHQHDIAVAIHKYIDGKCVMFGFNVEITYGDLEMLNLSSMDNIDSSVERTVFIRDSLILNILHQCGIN